MSFRRRTTRPLDKEEGQTFVLIVIFIAVFLAGVIGFATDYTQLWARRQVLQGAADAACQAGAADLFLQNQYSGSSSITVGGTTIDFGWIGTAYDCSTNTTSPPCQYASLNGFSGSAVSVSFPSSVPGYAGIPSGFGTIAHPYIKVVITHPVQLSFANLLLKTGTANVSATAYCGLNPVSVPIPMVVLHPTASGAFNRNGGATVTIYKGPNRSIQVDSDSATAVTPASGGSGLIDLSQAGPSGTGADFGVFGAEAQPGYVHLGTSGNWKSPATPYGDPWVTVSAPSVPTTNGSASYVVFGTNGCPDPAGCVEFTPGNYAGTGANACKSNNGNLANGGIGCLILPTPYNFNIPNWNNNHPYNAGALIQPTSHNTGNFVFQAQNTGTSQTGSGPNPWNQTVGLTTSDGTITWKNIGTASVAGSPKTAIFDPGLYYVGVEGIQLGSNTTVRQSTAANPAACPASGGSTGTSACFGTTFYFSHAPGSGQNTGTINVNSSTGGVVGCTTSNFPNCIVSYKTNGTTSQTFGGVTAVFGPAMQCPSGTSIPSEVPNTIDGNLLFGPCSGTYGSSDGKDRGFLFFQNRATSVSASWKGGGAFLLSGFMYFHNSSSHTTTLEMAGNSSGNAYTLGNVIADEITISGSSAFKMILNPNVTFQVLRPQLLH
ncbi:MAG: pilus assembly protein TadG-related protein [Terriglobales bacterium]